MKGLIFLMDNTLKYYNTNAEEYFKKTLKAGNAANYARFLDYIPEKSSILDLGCGSGRDSYFFKESGYSVVGIDNSKELCRLAKEKLKINVLNIDMSDMDYIENFDAVWANSSILHLNSIAAQKCICKVHEALVKNGIFYVSVKEGDGMEKGERFFQYYSSESLFKLLEDCNFRVLEFWKSDDDLGRNTTWLNVIARKI